MTGAGVAGFGADEAGGVTGAGVAGFGAVEAGGATGAGVAGCWADDTDVDPGVDEAAQAGASTINKITIIR